MVTHCAMIADRPDMILLPQPSRGCFAGKLHRYAVIVYYEDTDAGGVVYHANYMRWYERARTDMLALLGIDQRVALEAGIGAYVVAEADLRFRAPARLGDTIIIETRLVELRAASVRLDQTAVRDGIVLNTARLRVGFAAPDGRPCRQPEEWRAAFSPYVHRDDSFGRESPRMDAEKPERQR